MQNDNKSSRILFLITAILVALGSFLLLKGITHFEQLNDSLPSGTLIQSSLVSQDVDIAGISGQEARVTRVIDGDTIEVQIAQNLAYVRYIGIDSPETVDPKRGVQCFGKQASDENKKLVGGKTIILVKDVSETDKYDRLLRYVYVKLKDENILFANDYLVRQGFAKAYTLPPDVKYSQTFLEAEREARENRKGLWNSCVSTPRVSG